MSYHQGEMMENADQTQRLTDSANSIAAEMASLTEEVKVQNEASKRYRKIIQILAGVLIAKFITLILLSVLLVQTKHSGQAIEDCTTPTGSCAQRAAVQYEVARKNIEIDRNQTEIGLAERRGDTVAIEYRRQVIADAETAIRKILEQANGK